MITCGCRRHFAILSLPNNGIKMHFNKKIPIPFVLVPKAAVEKEQRCQCYTDLCKSKYR